MLVNCPKDGSLYEKVNSFYQSQTKVKAIACASIGADYEVEGVIDNFKPISPRSFGVMLQSEDLRQHRVYAESIERIPEEQPGITVVFNSEEMKIVAELFILIPSWQIESFTDYLNSKYKINTIASVLQRILPVADNLR